MGGSGGCDSCCRQKLDMFCLSVDVYTRWEFSSLISLSHCLDVTGSDTAPHLMLSAPFDLGGSDRGHSRIGDHLS